MRAIYGRLVRLPGASLAALGVFFAALIIVVFLLDLQARYRAVLSEAKREALNIAEILAEHTALTFEGIDRTLLEAERIREGSFAGVIAAPLDPRHFAQVYRAIDVGEGGSVLLLHRVGTGRILARQPQVEGAIGKSFADSPLLSEYLPKSESGSYETVSIVDGVARIASYKAVAGLPLVL